MTTPTEDGMRGWAMFDSNVDMPAAFVIDTLTSFTAASTGEDRSVVRARVENVLREQVERRDRHAMREDLARAGVGL